MQTAKASASPLEVSQKASPATAHAAHQVKTSGSESGSISSNPACKTPKSRSPKVVDRRSPRSPAPEKKRPTRISELELQLARLQEDLKKTKEQLSSSESWKRRAQHEAEEAKNQLLVMSAKLEESEQQMLELSASEEDRIQELRKISHDRDREWQSELEAVQKQHSIDTAALSSALNEIQKLKVQLEMVIASEAAQSKHAESAYEEIDKLRKELAETLSLVESLKAELSACKESEAQALEAVGKTQAQLEIAKETEEALRSDGLKAIKAYNLTAMELEQSKARMNEIKENEDTTQLRAEINLVKIEVSQLRSALDAAEVRYQEEYIQSTLHIRSAYEQVERVKSESCTREAELRTELKRATANIEELKANLMDKDTELQNMSEENEALNLKIEKNHLSERKSERDAVLKKMEENLADMKSGLIDKETELQSLIEENERLKLEMKKEMDRNIINDEVAAAAEMARAAEQEALAKLGYLTEEADKSSRKVARVAEQIDAMQAANSEREAELRRLKVQSDQWRKAAEAAAAMLSPGTNGKLMERTLDRNYQTIGGKMGSPYLDDSDDDSPKKKNGNMLKKIGVLWKKGQK